MRYRVFVVMPDGESVGNAMRFGSVSDAERYGIDLLMRWFAPEHYEVLEELVLGEECPACGEVLDGLGGMEKCDRCAEGWVECHKCGRKPEKVRG